MKRDCLLHDAIEEEMMEVKWMERKIMQTLIWETEEDVERRKLKIEKCENDSLSHEKMLALLWKSIDLLRRSKLTTTTTTINNNNNNNNPLSGIEPGTAMRGNDSDSELEKETIHYKAK